MTSLTAGAVSHLPDGLAVSEAKLRLFEAAVELFGERGYHGVSMRDLAEAVGVKGASLYAHVPSKQHLLLELAQIGFSEHHSRIREALLDAGNDPADQMRALVRAHVLMQLRHSALARICSRELGHLDVEGQQAAVAIRAQSEELFLAVVDRGCALGEFTVSDPRRAMRAIADMGIRAAEWPRPHGPDEQVADDYAGYALRILA
jgi:AcrR family transcriptional regulator